MLITLHTPIVQILSMCSGSFLDKLKILRVKFLGFLYKGVLVWILELATGGEVGVIGLWKSQKWIRRQAFIGVEDSQNVPISVSRDAPGRPWVLWVGSRSASSSSCVGRRDSLGRGLWSWSKNCTRSELRLGRILCLKPKMSTDSQSYRGDRRRDDIYIRCRACTAFSIRSRCKQVYALGLSQFSVRLVLLVM